MLRSPVTAVIAPLVLAVGVYARPVVATLGGDLGCLVSRQLAGDRVDWAARSGRSCAQPDAVLLGWPALQWSALTCICLVLLFVLAAARVYARRARVAARWAGVGALFALVAVTAIAAVHRVVPGSVVQALALLA